MHWLFRIGLPEMHGQFCFGLPKVPGRFCMEQPGWLWVHMVNYGPTQKEKNLGSRVALLPWKFLPSRKFFKEKKFLLWKKSFQKKKPSVKYLEYFRIFSEYFKTVWKIPGKSGQFLDSMEDFQTVREILWTVWKISGYSGRFLDSMEDFRTVLIISWQSGESEQSGNGSWEDFWLV